VVEVAQGAGHKPRRDCGIPRRAGEVKMTEEVMYWSDLADLTHQTQVEKFGFCTCEDNEGNENPYADCPEEAR
jgi:hypothetical protein